MFFEIPSILSRTLAYVEYLKNAGEIIITNFIQGELWKEKSNSMSDKIVLPLFLYYDDYKTNDTLAGSLAGVSNPANQIDRQKEVDFW